MPTQTLSPEITIFEEKAEKMLTPKQRAMSTASSEVLKHKTDLIAAGATEEIVKNAADLAARRVEEEFTQTEKTSPLIRLQTALETMVIPGQQYWLDQAEIGLQTLSEQIIQEHTTASIAAERANQPYDPLMHFQRLASYNKAPNNVNLVSVRGYDAPTVKTLESTLRAIGILKPQETIEQLQKTVPFLDMNTPDKAGQEGGRFYNLPTMVEGVTAYFDPLRYNISLMLTPEAIVKSLPPENLEQ